MSVIIKTIKFDLPVDGVKVKNLDELREHFTVEILDLYQSGILLKWLQSRNFTEEFEAVSKLQFHDSKPFARMKKLCEIFDVDTDDSLIAMAVGEPPEKIEKNFSEIKAEAAEAKKPTVSGKYLVYKNGTVTDTETQLMWKQASEEDQYKWENAMAKFGKNVSFAGYDDWRMPTKEELAGLVDKQYSPTINPIAFSNTQAEFYWSSTSNNSSYAWVVYFGYGNGVWGNRNFDGHVRLVRSGQ